MAKHFTHDTPLQPEQYVLKPGHYFYMDHYRNEGDAANYYGLHQWNFDVEDDCFVIKNRYGESSSCTPF